MPFVSLSLLLYRSLNFSISRFTYNKALVYHLDMKAANVTESVTVLLLAEGPVIASMFLSEPNGMAVPIGTGLGLI
jgi:hypothetical protein